VLQQFHPALDAPFQLITSTGDEAFMMFFVAAALLVPGSSVGIRMLALFILSTYVNVAAKVLADQPRPRLYDSRVWAYSDVGGTGGFPSNHTQNSVILWGYLCMQLRKRWLWIVGIALVILTPLSRL
jgi:membrane-associated phospholipid phosphatase